MSKNRLSIAQISLACRHVDEMLAAGVTENLSIRTLELFADVYARMLLGGSAVPHHPRQVQRSQWSLAALEQFETDPGSRLRVEHGTPMRAFARYVLQLYHSERLTEATLEELVRASWKLAVITLEEDGRLNKVARSSAMASPDERWALAGIRFPAAG